MNKLTKLLFSVISSVMLVTSAYAGDFAVTGGVKTTYTILSNSGTTGTHGVGKGLGISNEFSLSASGELDNGMTWSYAQDIDGATVQMMQIFHSELTTVLSKFVYLSVDYLQNMRLTILHTV